MGVDGAPRELSETERVILEFLARCDGGQAALCVECIARSTSTAEADAAEALWRLEDEGYAAARGDGYVIDGRGEELLAGVGEIVV